MKSAEGRCLVPKPVQSTWLEEIMNGLLIHSANGQTSAVQIKTDLFSFSTLICNTDLLYVIKKGLKHMTQLQSQV